MKYFLAAVFLTLCATTANAAIIYDVNRTIGDGTVTGFIETNGTIGVLGKLDITDWSLTLTAPNLVGGASDSFNFDTGDTILLGTAVSATSTQLMFDFAAPQAGASVLLFMSDATANFWCLEISGCSAAADLSEQIGNAISDTVAQLESHTGTVAFATVTAVPIPAAVWLFASGLLGLIGFARRRR